MRFVLRNALTDSLWLKNDLYWRLLPLNTTFEKYGENKNQNAVYIFNGAEQKFPLTSHIFVRP